MHQSAVSRKRTLIIGFSAGTRLGSYEITCSVVAALAKSTRRRTAIWTGTSPSKCCGRPSPPTPNAFDALNNKPAPPQASTNRTSSTSTTAPPRTSRWSTRRVTQTAEGLAKAHATGIIYYDINRRTCSRSRRWARPWMPAATGIVLYAMAIGRRLFQGDTSAALFNEILHKALASPVSLNPMLPGALEHIINRPLEKDWKARCRPGHPRRARGLCRAVPGEAPDSPEPWSGGEVVRVCTEA